MKYSKELYKKIAIVICDISCMLLMFCKVINYKSVAAYGGTQVGKSLGVSLYNLLFNKNMILGDYAIYKIYDTLKFSCVVMWISFVLSIVSIVLLIVGFVSKKNIYFKVGSILFVFSIIELMLINFCFKKTYITTRSLNVYTYFYLLILLISIGSLSVSLSIKKK